MLLYAIPSSPVPSSPNQAPIQVGTHWWKSHLSHIDWKQVALDGPAWVITLPRTKWNSHLKESIKNNPTHTTGKCKGLDLDWKWDLRMRKCRRHSNGKNPSQPMTMTTSRSLLWKERTLTSSSRAHGLGRRPLFKRVMASQEQQWPCRFFSFPLIFHKEQFSWRALVSGRAWCFRNL